MNALIAAELFKLRRRRMTWILAATVVVLCGAVYALLFATVAASSSAPGDETISDLERALAFDNVITFGDAIAFRVATMMTIILAGTMAAGEFGWRTVLTGVTRAGDRRRLVLAKVAALAIAAAAAIALAFGAIVATDLAGNIARTESAHASATFPAHLALAVGRGWLLAVVYVALTVAIAFATRSTAAAIAVPLGILLLEPFGAAALGAIGGPIASLRHLTLSYNVDGVLAANGPVRGTSESLDGYPPEWRSAALLMGLIAILVVATVRSFVRRDLTE
ncbi:MAG: hypothetical protein Kow0010_12150 [Dehalococcoidia bacterium]